MDGSFGRFDHRADEGVGGFVEDERKAHLVAVDAYVIIDHFGLDKILAVARIAHLLERIKYKFRI